MLKRKSDGGGDESASKKAQGGETAVAPLPIHLPLNYVDVFFEQRTWEEIAPGELYYVPVCQNPIFMMDVSLLNRFKKFKTFSEYFTMSKPKVRLSNPTMLQDDLRVQSNTPTDATAFTQVIYLMKYCPRYQNQYYKLQTLIDEKTLEGSDLTYNLHDIDLNKRLIKMRGNYQGFDNLLICTSKVDYNPWNMVNPGYTIDKQTGEVDASYISPNQIGTNKVSGFANVCAATRVPKSHFCDNAYVTSLAKNTDSISFHKYGDTIEFEVETNLEGVNLRNTAINDFTTQLDIKVEVSSILSRKYRTQWCYPGKNRGYYSRKYLDSDMGVVLNNFDYKPLSHTFFSMPPIKKPNGALLGQRCSILMEQSFHCRFYAGQAATGVANDESSNFQKQQSLVSLRRLLIPTPYEVDNLSPFCINGLAKKDISKPLGVTDDLQGLETVLNKIAHPDMKELITLDTTSKCGKTIWLVLNDEFLHPTDWSAGQNGLKWINLIHAKEKKICVFFDKVFKHPVVPDRYLYFKNEMGECVYDGKTPPQYMTFDLDGLMKLTSLYYPNAICAPDPNKAEPMELPLNFQSNVFHI